MKTLSIIFFLISTFLVQALETSATIEVNLTLSNKTQVDYSNVVVEPVFLPKGINLDTENLNILLINSNSTTQVRLIFNLDASEYDWNLKDQVIRVQLKSENRVWKKNINLNLTRDQFTPSNFELTQNYPNPFNPSTTIRYSLPKSGMVSLKIYDILGKEVKTLLNENKEAGYHQITFDAGNLASGIYFYTLKAGNFVSTKKLTLMK
jgi:hypothetical protein